MRYKKPTRSTTVTEKCDVYLIECEVRYVKSNILAVTNYKSTQRKLVNKEAVPKQALKQKRFQEHYCSDTHHGIADWVITLIDRANTLKKLKRKSYTRCIN